MVIDVSLASLAVSNHNEQERQKYEDQGIAYKLKVTNNDENEHSIVHCFRVINDVTVIFGRVKNNISINKPSRNKSINSNKENK